MLKGLILVVFIFLPQAVLALSYTLEISEEELQEKVSPRMQIEKRRYFVTVKNSNPRIDLVKETNEVEIVTNIKAKAPGNMKGSGRAMLVGSLHYNSEEKAFYFHEPRVIHLEVDKVPSKFIPKIKRAVQLATSKAMSIYPVYRLNNDTIKHRVASAVFKSVAVEN